MTIGYRQQLPFVSIRRNGRALLIQPEFGNWLGGPSRYEAAMRDELERTIMADPSPYFRNVDYPLECTLYLTNSCNAACVYCYSERLRGGRKAEGAMTPRQIETIVAQVLRSPFARINFFLYGGEPMMAPELMAQVVDTVHRHNQLLGKTVTFNTTSNGTLLDARRIDLLKEKGIGIGVSFDGPPEIQNRNRPFKDTRPSFDEVMKGLERLTRAEVSFAVTSTVVDPGDIEPTLDFFLKEQVAHRIRLAPCVPEGNAEDQQTDYDDFARRFGEEHLRAADRLLDHNRTSPFWITDTQLFTAVNNLITKERPDFCLRAPCGAAFGMIEFHPNGEIVTCDKHYYTGKLPPIGRVEDLERGDSLGSMLARSPVIRQLQARVPDAIEECRGCTFKRFCESGCSLGSYLVFGSFLRKDVLCEYRKVVFEGLMWRLAESPLNHLLLTDPEKAQQQVSPSVPEPYGPVP